MTFAGSLKSMSKKKADNHDRAPMPPALIDKVASRFRALSDPNRLQLLQLLIEGDRSVNAIAEAAGLSLANASKHLALLCAAGFIVRRKDGTRAIYALANDTPKLLCDLVCRDVKAQVERDAAIAGEIDVA